MFDKNLTIEVLAKLTDFMLLAFTALLAKQLSCAHFFKGGLRVFNNSNTINRLKNLKPTPSIPFLKKGEAESSFASTSIINDILPGNDYESIHPDDAIVPL